ncbi:(deoxy)nucleoside triphosphate pyrophosphohydrolase [Verrucomicrobiaceae bacterium R5-34]|uniref:8-oxo-dGTP diphosphatase n=1 Tax=Oceaniferula flava TaxID=2800421 RepID=A0AAE2SAQ2_9BACT|nr:(deoxy)nucleoside triphosphate pyrophosphohydrolase [Oceaniferula flavus]MBK1830560.1 (deoxy)nucleoside triphosphate pyrophosphohydrolase [Verrucomicrobiaceae bacterium R5-34]MBK1854656.1 (deoxy)nucleoside triphosphate pyrophosphohydrolase [Oceaniferula flavus]MBM1135962.1 (deoxy)nucleoside triphosphate pyrophosphohydrolase [Oceaniferula flavus]
MINVVCAVLMDAEGRWLCCQRPEGKSLAGKWEFPGGKIEPGETAPEALRREIEEELGCLVHVQQELSTVEHHYEDFSIRLTPYLCVLEEGVPVAREHTEIRWVAGTHLAALDWAAADVPIWQEVLARG